MLLFDFKGTLSAIVACSSGAILCIDTQPSSPQHGGSQLLGTCGHLPLALYWTQAPMAHSTVRRVRFGEPWEEIVSKRWAIRHRGDWDAVANEERMRVKRQRIDLGDARNQVQLMGICLRQWAIKDAWAVCMRCDAAVCKAFSLHDLGNTELRNLVETCKYCNTGYMVPSPDDIPVVLVNLRPEQLEALRPITLHQGDYTQCRHGLRRHGKPSMLKWSETSVTARIDNLDPYLQDRARDAYEFLMGSDKSAYPVFVRRHVAALADGLAGRSLGRLALLERHIECALWPDLYPDRAFCESIFAGGQQKYKSVKDAFMAKLASPLLDYGLLYDLLQFQFDRWVVSYFTARASAAPQMDLKWLLRKFPDSPQQNYHTRLCILDLHRQFGAGAFFITLAPGMYRMPWPLLVENIRTSGRAVLMGCSALESLHVIHVLKQLAEAYIVQRDKRELRSPYCLFTGSRTEGPIVEASVTKYEYQDGTSVSDAVRQDYHGTGVKHSHTLVWVKNPHRNSLLKWLSSTGGAEDPLLQQALQEMQKTTGKNAQGIAFGASEPNWYGSQMHLEGDGPRACVAPLALARLCHSDVTVVCDPGQVQEYMVKLCRYVGKDVSGLDEHWLENASSGLAAAYTYLHRSKPSTMKMVDLLSRATNVHFSCYTKEVMLNLPTETWRSDLVQKYMRCPLRKNICYLDWRGPIIANWCDVWRNIVHTLQKTLQAHSCKSVHEVPLVKHFSDFV